MRTFWANFEERVTESENSSVVHATQTQTRTREEPDQDNEITGQSIFGAEFGNTKTITETREEDDQDEDIYQYSAITLGATTKTRTATREENDQDEGIQASILNS